MRNWFATSQDDIILLDRHDDLDRPTHLQTGPHRHIDFQPRSSIQAHSSVQVMINTWDVGDMRVLANVLASTSRPRRVSLHVDVNPRVICRDRLQAFRNIVSFIILSGRADQTSLRITAKCIDYNAIQTVIKPLCWQSILWSLVIHGETFRLKTLERGIGLNSPAKPAFNRSKPSSPLRNVETNNGHRPRVLFLGEMPAQASSRLQNTLDLSRVRILRIDMTTMESLTADWMPVLDTVGPFCNPSLCRVVIRVADQFHCAASTVQKCKVTSQQPEDRWTTVERKPKMATFRRNHEAALRLLMDNVMAHHKKKLFKSISVTTTRSHRFSGAGHSSDNFEPALQPFGDDGAFGDESKPENLYPRYSRRAESLGAVFG